MNDYQTRSGASVVFTFFRDLGKFFKGVAISLFSPAFLCIFIPLLILWEVLPRTELVHRSLVPTLSDVMVTLYDMFANRGFVLDIIDSLHKFFTGLVLSISIAVPLGILMGWNEAIRKRVLPLFQMLAPIPPPAWVPISIIFLGIGFNMQVFLIFLGTFYPLLFSTFTAVKETDPRYVASARSFGASELTLILKVYIWHAMVPIVASIRTAVNMGLIMLLIAEMYGGRTGIGFVLNEAREFFQIPVMVACMFTLGMIGFFMNEIIKFIELKLAVWKGVN